MNLNEEMEKIENELILSGIKIYEAIPRTGKFNECNLYWFWGDTGLVLSEVKLEAIERLASKIFKLTNGKYKLYHVDKLDNVKVNKFYLEEQI